MCIRDRGPAEVDAVRAVAGQYVVQPGAALVCGQVAPVQVGDRDGRVAQHHQQRLGHVLPDDPGPQHLGAVADVLPGGGEGPRVGHTVQDEGELLEVDTAVVLGEAVEEHARLGGGERVHVRDRRRIGAGDPVHGGLVEPGEREVGRGAPGGAGPGGVPGQVGERVGEAVRQVRDRLLPVQPIGVEPGELQAVADELADDLQGVRTCGRRVGVQLQRPDGAPVEPVGVLRQPHPAQVVEADLRLRGERRRPRVRQVAQRVMAQTVPGHGAHLLLDPLEHGVPAGVLGDGEGDGVPGGEPADRAADVQFGEEFLAAVALDVDHHPVPAGPGAQRSAEGAEQDVVGLGAVGVGQGAQQGGGVLGAQAHGDGAL